MSRVRSYVKPLDGVVVAVVLLAALLIWLVPLLGAAQGQTVVVRTQAETLTYPLAEDRVIDIESGGYHLHLRIEAGTVRVTDTDCPNRLCQKVGTISRVGQVIVCVPAAVLVSIDGEADYDGTSY
ncbi:MAG: NusG domain II-containing protein [Eubacteriales bacterium]